MLSLSYRLGMVLYLYFIDKGRVGGVAQLVVASSLMLKGIEFDPG